jgi:hypothetical protein
MVNLPAAPLSRKEMLIIIMTTNPKPRYLITFKNAQSARITRDSHRSDVFFVVDTLEMQGWMKGILCL